MIIVTHDVVVYEVRAPLSLEPITVRLLSLKLWRSWDFHFFKVILIRSVVPFSLGASRLVRSIVFLTIRLVKLMLWRTWIIYNRVIFPVVTAPCRWCLLVLAGKLVHGLAWPGDGRLGLWDILLRLRVTLSFNLVILGSNLAPIHGWIFIT